MIGTPVTLAEFVAAMPGTLPTMRGGLLITGTEEACVATEEVELDLAGECGRCDPVTDDAGGDGAVKELVDPRC